MIKRVYLEITDSCNLNCPFCTNEKGKSFMNLEDVKRTIDQIKYLTDYVYLHVIGEPTLHPKFNEILDYLDLKEMKLQLVTNGTLLNRINLNHSCLRKLSISLHSISNLDIKNQEYFENINRLINSNNGFTLELRFYNLNNLDGTLKMYLDSLKNKFGLKDTNKRNSYKLKDNVYLLFEDLFDWPSIDTNQIFNSGTCKGAKEQLAILANQDVTICCLDPNGYNKIGNLKEKSLNEILSSSKYKDIIDAFNNNKLTMELCKRCSYMQRFH